MEEKVESDRIIGFRCPDRLRARIEAEAERRFTTMSAIVRETTAKGLGLEEYVTALERENGDDAE